LAPTGYRDASFQLFLAGVFFLVFCPTQGMDQNPETELLKRITEGDHLAFTDLFDGYHHTLGAFIYNITKSKELAEEITLDVFLKIWMTREALSEVKNFKAYLFTVSRNAAISSLRKIANERTKHIEWTKTSFVVDDDTGEKETYLSLIDEAIDHLSPQRKKIYLLSREKGLKYEEIAVQLGISRFTVRAHIQQATDSIVQYVKGRIDSPALLVWIVLNFL
jgi:RNA polymerase sigma-70 factor (family 1)